MLNLILYFNNNDKQLFKNNEKQCMTTVTSEMFV